MNKQVLQPVKLEKIRRDFIANVSHELRTPLTVVSGYLELLIDQAAEKVDATHKRIFEQMQNQTNRMQRLVEDLLLLSSIESAELSENLRHEVNVADTLFSVCEDARTLSGESCHQLHLDVSEAVTLMGEAKELRSAFSNLIFNAVRYTPAGGDIFVKWFEENGQKILSVRDTGVGIEAKHIPRLTERFYRVDKSRSRDEGGTGLGLAIVKHVMIRHQGCLLITSEINQGSDFRCCFSSE